MEQKKQPSFSIVIPAFNEERGIDITLKSLVTDPFFSNTEIIVIDDGSIDGTASQVAQFENVILIQHIFNKGYGSALVSGMRAATGDFVVWMDADGQHQVGDMKALIDKLSHGNWDYCIGIRNQLSHSEPTRKLGKWILRKVVQLAVGQAVPDFNSGLRGFRHAIISKYLHLLPHGFGASTTTTLVMLERGYKGTEVPITVLKRIGKSSVKQVRDGARTLMLILRIFLIFKPLHFFGAIGGIVFICGLIYSLQISLMEGGGFPVLGAVVLLTGVQVMLLGLVMDQVSALRRERFE